MSFKPNPTVANERTPLINGESASSNGNHHHLIHQDHSKAYQFFFDSKHTPGNDSENVVVRSLAYTWHITKVTMLSSKFSMARASCRA